MPLILTIALLYSVWKRQDSNLYPMLVPVASQKDLADDKIHVDAGLSNTPLLVVNRTNVSLAQDIAVALRASIVETAGHGRSLTRTLQDLSRFNAERQNDRRQWLEKASQRIGEYRKKYALTASTVIGELEGNEAQVTAIRSGSDLLPSALFPAQLLPSYIYLDSELKAIGTKEMCSAPDGEKLLWEDEPSFGAVQLPTRSHSDKDYVLATSAMGEETTSKRFDYLTHSLSSTAAFLDWAKPLKLPAKLRFSVGCYTESLALSVEGYDESGSLCLFNSLYALPSSPWLAPYFIERKVQRESVIKQVILSEKSISYLKRIQDGDVSLLLDWMSNDKIEPLNLVASEGLEFLANENKLKSFIFVADDNLWDAAKLSTKGNQLNLTLFKALLSDCFHYERFETKDSVIWRPKLILTGRSTVADRRLLQKEVHEVLENGLTLKDLCRFTHQQNFDTPLLDFYRSVISKYRDREVITSRSPRELVGFLGGLSDDAWSQLDSGESRNLIQLDAVDGFADVLRHDKLVVQSNGPFADLYRHANEILDAHALPEVELQIRHQDIPLIGIRNRKSSHDYIWKPLDKDFRIGIIPMAPDKEGTMKPLISRDAWEASISRSLELIRGDQKVEDVLIKLKAPYFSIVHFEQPIKSMPAVFGYSDLPQEFRDDIWKHLTSRDTTARTTNNASHTSASPL